MNELVFEVTRFLNTAKKEHTSRLLMNERDARSTLKTQRTPTFVPLGALVFCLVADLPRRVHLRYLRNAEHENIGTLTVIPPFLRSIIPL
ncbi:MAG: hypothetical protein MUC65_00530 [Pontiellaceae bacterium]|jgi:hypothetical protein|nr:hypothetical protein [Pontiellaceae bacterium]